MYEIRPAELPRDLAAVRRMFREYATALGIDLAFQDFDAERLYVNHAARGEKLGRRLALAVCQEARVAGYSRICLDTLPSMAAAHRLYASLGFRPIGSYVFNPIPGTVFLALDL